MALGVEVSEVSSVSESDGGKNGRETHSLRIRCMKRRGRRGLPVHSNEYQRTEVGKVPSASPSQMG